MEYVPFCNKYLPGFPICHIGRDLYYAREFLKVPDVSFNILQKVLVGPAGQSFLRDVRAAGRDVFVWTVNKPNGMRWSIRNEVDGVLTDDPAAFIKFCEDYDGQCTKEDEPSFEAYLIFIGVNIWTILTCFRMLFRWLFGRQFSSTWPVSEKNARRSGGFA
jgi:phosphatidylglycerol phospholipase C